MMQCSIKGCPGVYEGRSVVHTVRHKGEVIVIDHVPAEVCTLCGDVLFRPATVRRIEEILLTRRVPSSTVPLYEYA
jgi:YgiT-type zinc finger domain-containing protein